MQHYLHVKLSLSSVLTGVSWAFSNTLACSLPSLMGLGKTHLATGMTKLIQHRDEVSFYWPHALWTVNILIYILLVWWGMFWWSGHDDWFVYEYLFITLYAIVLFVLAAMLLPWDMERNIDIEECFFKHRLWFFWRVVCRLVPGYS